MSDLFKEKSDLHIARCQESKAHNDLGYCIKQAEDQEYQLAELLKHREECVEGLKMAKKTGMTPLHIHELQILVKHIDAVVELLSYKVDASQKNLEIAEDVWQEKNEYFETVKEAKNEANKTPVEDIPEEDNDDSTDGWRNKAKSKSYYGGDYPSTMANKIHKSR